MCHHRCYLQAVERLPTVLHQIGLTEIGLVLWVSALLVDITRTPVATGSVMLALSYYPDDSECGHDAGSKPSAGCACRPP